MGTFKERIQWVGDPLWKDGSIVIHNLDYSDNGTFTCDVKNPPDIVGKTSQVTLYVFEKGVRGGGMWVWEGVQRGDRASLRGRGKGQNAGANAPQALGEWAEDSLGWDVLQPKPQGISVGLGTKDTCPCSFRHFFSYPF